MFDLRNIQNETFYDLLNGNGHKKEKDIKNIAEIQIKSLDELIQIFKLANGHRKTANTII